MVRVMNRVLIVDDEMDVLELAREVLEESGYKVLASPDGTKAYALVADYNPDLILLDVVMPDISGLDILRQLRHNKETRDIKVILFTALGSEVDVMLEKKDKADDYILKPFNNKELVEKVAKHLIGLNR